MKFLRSGLLAALASASLAGAATAEPVTYAIDPAHTLVGFNIRHIFTKVSGRFDKFDGTIVYDAAKPAESKVDVTIESTSINTNNDRRDNHLRSADFFEVDKYPALTFTSTRVTVGKDNALTVDGTLSMHGVSRPVTLQGTILGADPNVAGFELSTALNRKDYNIVWNKIMDNGGAMLDDNVAITLEVEAHKPRPAPPTGAAPAHTTTSN